MTYECIMRDGLYRRKSDGMTVNCGDWPDGDTSWMLDPVPLISRQKIVGTMPTEEFDRLHVKEAGDGS